MATRKRRPANESESETVERATSDDARLLVNNVTKEHVLAVPLPGGLVGIVPVTTRSDEQVAAEYTDVENTQG